MKYVTAMELFEEWGISSRMITIYCKKGRIGGAIKKGKLWLIPANAQRPGGKGTDARSSGENIIVIDENIAVKGIFSVQNKVEVDSSGNTYYGGSIYENLGLTRDTLRYYEKIGLIEPRRNIENSYREFDFSDIGQFITIDFYKKRGFSLLEIKELMEQSNYADSSVALEKKAIEVEQSIYNQQCILERLKKTKELCKSDQFIGEKFEIKDFPLFSVLKSFDDARDISNYGDAIFRALDGEDILSNLVRAVSLDNSGYTGSKICIVKKVSGEHKDSQGVFLESGRCMYTAGIADEFFVEKIFVAAHKWANEHGLEHKGVAYTFARFILLGENKRQQFMELWIPIK